MTPTYGKPLIKKVRCLRASNSCSVTQAKPLVNYYQFAMNDIGYGDNDEKLWEFEFIDLPHGLTYSHTPISRRVPSYPGAYSRTPNSEITFKAGQLAAGDYAFTMRVYNPVDRNLYIDIPQVIRVK